MSNVSQIYKRTEVIGRGKFGIVYKGIHRTTRQIYAIKVLNLDTSEDEVKDVQQEIQFLSHLKQIPNVVHYYGSHLNGTKLWIIMDYCAGGSLRTLLKPGKIEEKYLGVIIREVLIALQFVHRQNVIHRDIKAANVLISNEGRVQLCDFGVAAQLTSTSVRRNTMAGTPYWMAPEVIMEGASYDVKADIWSLGITIYEIATGNPPYCDKEAIRAMQLITKSKPPRLEGKQYSPLLKEIIALCLDENPQERMNAEDLLKSRFVKHHKNSQISLLKELISRYLLWREKKSSRESILMNLEDEADENEVELKWDFDSLSSNEYILENDINVNNLNLNEGSESSPLDFNFTNSGDYDDGDDEFMTGYQNFNHQTQSNNVTYTKNGTTFGKNTGTGTGTANFNIGSTLKASNTMNRKEAPKSLLQLFEESPIEDEEISNNNHLNHHNINHNHHSHEDNYEIPKISSAIGLHNLSSNNNTNHTSRVSTPIVEIEIPDINAIESQIPQSATTSHPPTDFPKPRSRANTLVHTQSAAGNLETRKTLDPAIQRRPTISSSNQNNNQNTSTTTSSLPQPQLQPPVHTSNSSTNLTNSSQPNIQSSINSLPPIIPRGTPSPKRELTSQVNSPSKLNIITSSPSKPSMKAIHSPNNPSPLLQPLNGSTQQQQQQQSQNTSQQFQNSNKSMHVKRNHQNLRLQMPTPTSLQFPKLLNNNSSLDENNQIDENINQFGINVSNIPMTMTPLTEKPPPSQQQQTQQQQQQPTQSSTSIAPKRKMTLTSQNPPQLPFLQNLNNQNHTNSSISSHSSSNNIEPPNNNDNIFMFNLDTSLFIDSESSKDKINNNMVELLNQFSNVLGIMEEKLNDLKE
ncbi:Serine/threonine-protein kinase [Wickerhamomyces ciferrii]|uniref:non-specific serine/threonine protein kinase n=1 Tax=Wickerhamomyces ciferrii (strain ATCC 14091 / BCRC 22168 / CBS 111 / JCM 3599 / NBRC 0793 / NRRL Y-1031 F-60-10) TaxID=1206466 RepID=K0KKS1_WICCF|nr:Serine/threonine-protein kinase [Wickerhamomyces ciferrii]CCH45780.1 Serine/threonine-protein kinase [Wickerhamomyces ciferrii]